jgi:hypothetical protein
LQRLSSIHVSSPFSSPNSQNIISLMTLILLIARPGQKHNTKFQNNHTVVL